MFEKNISRTKMIDHSLERYYNGVCYRLYKILCAGTAARGAHLKLRNCVLTMMLSTIVTKNIAEYFLGPFLTSVEVQSTTVSKSEDIDQMKFL